MLRLSSLLHIIQGKIEWFYAPKRGVPGEALQDLAWASYRNRSDAPPAFVHIEHLSKDYYWTVAAVLGFGSHFEVSRG